MERLEYPGNLEELKTRMETERPVLWEDLPDIPLYMDQVVSYLGRQLISFREGEGLTSAMINNYIKDGIVPRANGKRYDKEHLASLTAVAVLKQILSVRDLGSLMKHGVMNGEPEVCYRNFCAVLDAALGETANALETEEENLPELAVSLALRAYADVLACRRILDLVRGEEEGAQKEKKKKKEKEK